MRADGLSKIKYLKFLRLLNVNFIGSLSDLSSELGYLCWKGYPFECLPPTFQPNNLVELYLKESSIERLWKGTKVLYFDFLFLSFIKRLIK